MMDFENLMPYAFALIIALPIIVLLRQFVYNYIRLKNKELKLLAVKSNGDVKLQAYERMTLFLDRIKPSNLVVKFDKNLEVHEFIFLLEKSISEEFEYNSSQQLYISKNSWENIVASKNNILQLMRKTYENLNANASLQDFKTVFLMNFVSGGDYISDTIEELRREALLLN
ncbi:hypothetical protein [Cloacibacterium sp.]|jgi:hypothetical protein|uniref:DUF7935 family protein n=1 Tax=Cloacibacterium sp. TaxID=1913682 RepID=UPI0035B04752